MKMINLFICLEDLGYSPVYLWHKMVLISCQRPQFGSPSAAKSRS